MGIRRNRMKLKVRAESPGVISRTAVSRARPSGATLEPAPVRRGPATRPLSREASDATCTHDHKPMAEHPTFDMGEPPPLPGPGEPVDPVRGSRIESIKRHPTDPELALVTRINPDRILGPSASVSVEFYDEAVAEGRQWGLALEDRGE
jgi:hypothetical protein